MSVAVQAGVDVGGVDVDVGCLLIMWGWVL